MTLNATSNTSTLKISSMQRRGSVGQQKITPMQFQTPAPTRYNPSAPPPAIVKKDTSMFHIFEHDDECVLPPFPFATIRNEIDAEPDDEHLLFTPPFLFSDDGNVRSPTGVGEKRSRGDNGKRFALKVRRRLHHPSDHPCLPTPMPMTLTSPKPMPLERRKAAPLQPRNSRSHDRINLHAVAA